MGLPLRLDCVLCGLVTGRNRCAFIRLALAALASRWEARLWLSHCGGNQYIGNDRRNGFSVTTGFVRSARSVGQPLPRGFRGNHNQVDFVLRSNNYV